jgi:hypothetical protein
MGRKRKYADDAERNRMHRAKRKAELEALKAAAGCGRHAGADNR